MAGRSGPDGLHTAVVTGASRGIGRAIATTLVNAGVRTYMLARGGRELAAVAASLGDGAIPVVCDVSDADAVHIAVQDIAAETDGAPDALVNNAGLFPLAELQVMEPTELQRTLEVNVVAPFRLTRAFLPAMRARRSGHIVTLGSVADRLIFPENGAYAASKHGQRAMHEVLRQELHGSGVRASLVSPGATDTSIWDAIDPDNRAGFLPRSAMLPATAVADAVFWVLTCPLHVNVDELRVSRS